jgi:hypothetical protein
MRPTRAYQSCNQCEHHRNNLPVYQCAEKETRRKADAPAISTNLSPHKDVQVLLSVNREWLTFSLKKRIRRTTQDTAPTYQPSYSHEEVMQLIIIAYDDPSLWHQTQMHACQFCNWLHFSMNKNHGRCTGYKLSRTAKTYILNIISYNKKGSTNYI